MSALLWCFCLKFASKSSRKTLHFPSLNWFLLFEFVKLESWTSKYGGLWVQILLRSKSLGFLIFFFTFFTIDVRKDSHTLKMEIGLSSSTCVFFSEKNCNHKRFYCVNIEKNTYRRLSPAFIASALSTHHVLSSKKGGLDWWAESPQDSKTVWFNEIWGGLGFIAPGAPR